jgi:NAD(P)-dependent dehydrogenase (short-subunit alcohol dehydrogenase family)
MDSEEEEMRFRDKTAVITGAAHGIGEATAQRFSDEGSAVVVFDVDEQGERVAESLRSKGRSAVFVKGDVSVEQDVDRAIAAALDDFGSVDAVVNNAAITLPKGYLETSPQEWDRVLAVNLRSIYLFLRAATPHLRESRGNVVNVASFHASATIENFAAYAAAKSGVLGLTRSAALDLAPSGVRVNTVCPGIIETSMWQAWLEQVENADETVREVLKMQPLGRIGRPADVAGAIAFLASEDASYITGSTLFVDGGVTARLHHV